MIITYTQKTDQAGMIANPAHGELNRENEHFPVQNPFVPKGLVL